MKQEHFKILHFTKFILNDESVSNFYSEFIKETSLPKKFYWFRSFIIMLNDLLDDFFDESDKMDYFNQNEKHTITVTDEDKHILYIYVYNYNNTLNNLVLEELYSDYMFGVYKMNDESILEYINKIGKLEKTIFLEGEILSYSRNNTNFLFVESEKSQNI